VTLRIQPWMNPYLFGCLLLLLAWAVTCGLVYARGQKRDIREFWWGSFFCALLGFTEPLFVPEYWTPPSVLSLGSWDLESFLFCFAIGGIAAVLPEIPSAKRIFRRVEYSAWQAMRRARACFERLLLLGGSPSDPSPPADETRLDKRELRQENLLLVIFFIGTFAVTARLGVNIIYEVALTCMATAWFIWLRAPRLRWQVLSGGVTFVGIYTVILVLVRAFYPDFRQHNRVCLRPPSKHFTNASWQRSGHICGWVLLSVRRSGRLLGIEVGWVDSV